MSAISFILNLGLNLAQVTLLLRFWRQDQYGSWLTVTAAAGMLTALDGGHQAFVGNLLAREWVEERAKLLVTLGSALRVSICTAGIQIVVTLVLCLSGGIYRLLSVDPAASPGLASAIAIYVIGWISVGSVSSILVRLYAPAGSFARSLMWNMLMRVTQFFGVLLPAWLGWSLAGTALFFISLVIALTAIVMLDVWRQLPEVRPWLGRGDFSTGFRNLRSSTVLTATNVLDSLALQGAVLVISGGLGAALVPLFTTLRTLANTAMQGSSFLIQPIIPDLVRFWVNREPAKLTATFQFFWLVTGLLVNGGLIVGLGFVEPVYRFWTDGKLAFDGPLFGWLVAAVLARTLGAPLWTLVSTLNRLQAQLAISVARGAVSLGGALLLLAPLGLAGVGAAVAAGELAASVLLPAWFVAREYRQMGSRWPVAAFAWSAASTAAALLALTIFSVGGTAWVVWVIGAGLPVAGIAVKQWLDLPVDVKDRVSSLLMGWRRHGAAT